jgi:4-hydroxy-tetrahydrodipicolinate synthase
MKRASAFVVSITPFGPDGAFDEELIRRHLRRMGDAGIGVYLGGGGSGEGYALSSDEIRRLLEIGVDELKGEVPVRSMGVEPRTAQEMIAFLHVAARAGVDATQVYSLDQGHGHRPTTGEIRRYFEDVLSATDLPAVISTHQSVGYHVPVDMLADMADRYDHVIGINCSHQDVGYLAAIVDAVGDRLDIHVGGPGQALTAWALGATGFLTSEANLIPQTCMRVVRAFTDLDSRAMMEAFGKVLRLSTALYGAGGIRATKAVLDAFGLPGGPPRLPQLPVDADTVESLVELVKAMQLEELD